MLMPTPELSYRLKTKGAVRRARKIGTADIIEHRLPFATEAAQDLVECFRSKMFGIWRRR